MAITIRFIMCLCYCIFFFVVLFSIAILHCSASNCLEVGSTIVDGKNTLVSPGKVFELGFFTPDGNTDNRRYLGIWYYKQYNPKIIVWVANRGKPLLEPNGSLTVKNSSAKVLDTKGVTYWSTLFDPSDPPRKSSSLCLEDTGNLTFKGLGRGGFQVPWQSFHYPTDTFLPGMDVALTTLTSWETSNNPAPGNYVLPLNEGNQLIVSKNSSHYWESQDMPFDGIPQTLFDLFLNNFSRLEGYNTTRLVMNFTGQVQFWKWESKRGWFLNWSEPNDICDLNNICGNFGSCYSNNGFLCKCLPGFNVSSPKKWNSGYFTEGCLPRSAVCSRDYSKDLFLRMPMMKVSNQTIKGTTDSNCTDACLKECTCVAFSCGAANCTGRSNETCWRWIELTDLQEGYHDGLTIFVRSTLSDIELTSRDCMPCGTYTIPYPLGISASCGDPSYFDFHCNVETGQVSFLTSNGTFNVTLIDPEEKRFSIQVRQSNWCDSKYIDSILLSPKLSSLYTVGNCRVVKKPSFLEVEQSFVEVEIGWKPPPEPVCNVSSDCQVWPYTTCKVARNGGRRCLCRKKTHWNGNKMKCDKEVNFTLKVVVPCLAGALAIILLCGVLVIYHSRKGRLNEQQGSVEFKGDDTEGIDVPFFDWESILAATINFAEAYKLGTGGFGSVYMGKLPDGQEIAVKRLSSVSVQGLEEFRTEVKLIAKLQHRNLVRLIGYCMKADEKILVYEYMPNGSLDSCLFDEKHCVYLDWKQRFDIILGIARGLVYLHQDSRLRIIHRDLKPSNILLDEELNPKISDFGIARIVGGKETQASTNRVVGTYGYMSPEYASDGIFSVKSDVFSFGVVILETISGRRNSKIFVFEHGLSLLGHAWKLWNEDKGLELMDPKLNESCFPPDVLKCIHIGLLCVQEDPSDRPTMSTIVLMLSGENVSLPLAKQPAFMNRKPLSENASSSSAKDSSVHEMMTVSTIGR